ncbi:MAG: hypothetical protein WC866_00280 [Patescibacteria group bacterium]|jgi:hypothetical protein
MGQLILHAFMRRGWKKSSCMRLFCYLGHGIICLALLIGACLADTADPALVITVITSIIMIGIFVLPAALLEAVDQEDDPLIAKWGRFSKAAGLVLLIEIVWMLVRPPATVREIGLSFAEHAALVSLFSIGIALVAICMAVMSAAPLGYRPDPEKGDAP